MSSEHTLSLRATLDTSDVQQKLSQMNQQAQSAGNTASAAKDIDSMSEAFKSLRKAIGGGVLVHALGDIAKQMNIFGDQTNEVVGKFTSASNQMLAALQTGSASIIGFTAALTALSLSMGAVLKVASDTELEYAKLKGTQKQAEAVRKYQENVEVQKLAESGSKEDILKLLGMFQTQRQSLQGKVNDAMKFSTTTLPSKKDMVGTSAIAPDYGALLSDVMHMDNVIKVLTKALDRFKEAPDNFNDFLIELQQQASQLEEQLAEGYGAQGNAIKSQTIMPGASDYTQLLSLFGGGAMSGFSAAGFGMGEVSITTTISRQIDQVIRLLQDQLRKDLTVVNTGNTI